MIDPIFTGVIACHVATVRHHTHHCSYATSVATNCSGPLSGSVIWNVGCAGKLCTLCLCAITHTHAHTHVYIEWSELKFSGIHWYFLSVIRLRTLFVILGVDGRGVSLQQLRLFNLVQIRLGDLVLLSLLYSKTPELVVHTNIIQLWLYFLSACCCLIKRHLHRND